MLNELAGQVRNGVLDPVDLVKESLRRIQESSDLNAVTALWAEDALQAASAHDRKGALAGLPVLVKDMVRIKGRITTAGSALYADGPADTESDVLVERLTAAGAIVLGRTNTPEFGATATTVNKVFGATRNPWNKDKTSGGSSGGSAAALAAGLAPLATTSDGGGSVRGPASMCGLVGYKPSMGAIGRNILSRWIEFSTQGTTGSSVADVVLEASVTHGPARGDFLSLPSGSVPLTPRMPSRVIACRTFRSDIDPEIEENFEQTLRVLSDSGVKVERADAPSDNSTVWWWFAIATAELAQSLKDVRDRWGEFTDYVQNQLQYGSTVTADQFIEAMRMRHVVGARFDDLMGSDAVIVTPTTNARAWPAAGPMATSAGNTVDDAMIALNTTDANFTGHPAVSVPMGLDNHGVPTGMMITAPRFADSLALGLAGHIEKLQPWPLTAPGYAPFALS